MAIETYKVDDLDGTKGAETHKITLDGRTVVIDLAEVSYKQLTEFLAPYFEAGIIKETVANGDGETTKARAWLKENGHEVNDKGRIPDELMVLYRASIKS